MADFHSRALIFQSLVIFFSARYKSFTAASSLGKWPRFLIIFLSCMCRLSMALVV